MSTLDNHQKDISDHLFSAWKKILSGKMMVWLKCMNLVCENHSGMCLLTFHLIEDGCPDCKEPWTLILQPILSKEPKKV